MTHGPLRYTILHSFSLKPFNINLTPQRVQAGPLCRTKMIDFANFQIVTGAAVSKGRYETGNMRSE